MRIWILALLAVAIGGCQMQQKRTPQATNPAVLDVLSPAGYQPAVVRPAPVPAASVSPAIAPAKPAPAAAAAAPSGTAYTVKKGDTLFHIAREHYGDGKQWTRIAAANPGLTPTSLKVGQKLVMP